MNPPETTVYTFHGGADGGDPFGGLIGGATTGLYGTTTSAGSGSCQCGTVFKVTRTASGYSETVLYSFQGGTDGEAPWGTLVSDARGNLYGTTSAGGGSPCSGGCGTVFELARVGSSYHEVVLHRFRGGRDGAEPWAGLVMDASGSLYGTTREGGGAPACKPLGCGIVFKLTPAGSHYKETIIHRFRGHADGDEATGGLIMDNGDLFGTTAYGGTARCACGTVYELKPTSSGYQKSDLYRFTGGSGDGQNPVGGVVRDGNGNLFGTTELGGAGTPCSCGVVFELTPIGSTYSERILHSFGSGTDGSVVYSSPLLGPAGKLYGTTSQGGTHGAGTVYGLTPSRAGYSERVLYNFGDEQGDGGTPYAPVIERSGVLFGTTNAGGRYYHGTVFAVRV